MGRYWNQANLDERIVSLVNSIEHLLVSVVHPDVHGKNE